MRFQAELKQIEFQIEKKQKEISVLKQRALSIEEKIKKEKPCK